MFGKFLLALVIAVVTEFAIISLFMRWRLGPARKGAQPFRAAARGVRNAFCGCASGSDSGSYERRRRQQEQFTRQVQQDQLMQQTQLQMHQQMHQQMFDDAVRMHNDIAREMQRETEQRQFDEFSHQSVTPINGGGFVDNSFSCGGMFGF